MPAEAESPSLTAEPALPDWSPPTRLAAAVFAAKRAILAAGRSALDLVGGPAKHAKGDPADFPVILAQSATALWGDDRESERAHQRGKVHNLRRAAAALNGVRIPTGETFSFWRQIGPATAARGYARGRMLQQGCLVAAAGGGLCQLSNALYQAALDAGCGIVERHGHSRAVPGSDAQAGRDATVAWNYVDLRFRSPETLLIEARLTADTLVVRFRGEAGRTAAPVGRAGKAAGASATPKVRSCSACGETACFRHGPAVREAQASSPRTAFLVDETWPELTAYVAETRGPGDVLGAPFSGLGFVPHRYSWPTEGFARVGSAATEVLARTWAVRRAGDDNPARRRAELEGGAAIARRLARLAGPEVERLVVAQSLLPFLWRDGELGGRSFEVLMTRLPIHVLQARLDAAFAAHPDRRSLGDFRAGGWLAEAEREALAAADRIVTPHAAVADLFGDRAVEIPWRAPPAPQVSAPAGRRIAFPGPTAARKGAWEVREAARSLDLEVARMGCELEGPGFWDGVKALAPDCRNLWTAFDGVAAVVQPAVAEDQPRPLLAALAAGLPVVATEACGLRPRPGLTLVPVGDVAALTAALAEILDARP
jgi:hypothetical protein